MGQPGACPRVLAAALPWVAPAQAADSLTCTGRFPNPITEICWSCILPISIGSATIANFDGQEDIPNPSNPVCSCGVNPTIGLSIGFWEPARHVEAVRKPFCLASLGGIDLDPGIPAPAAARFTRPEGDGDGGSFYQAHFYVNPVLYWLEVVTDFPCLERGSFDLAYLTEVDPLWNDDELTLILNPEAVLFANPVAVAACAADCVAATAGFGIAEMFWCAGCQGGIYPFDGHVPYHMGGVRTAALIAQRLTAKMHRELLAWGWHGGRACAGPTSCRPWTRPPTRPSSPTRWPTPPRTAAAAASPSAAAPSSGAPARSTRCAARTSPSCCSGRGTAVWATDSKGFDLQNGAQATAMAPGKAGPKVLIFVSFAMPEATLQRLVDQAARAGATLVLRGLVNGSIRDTVTRMQGLIGSRRVAVQIDPEAFDRYGITRTPSFVLAMDGAGTEACASRLCGSSQQFVKVSGDVTLEYAMQYLNRDGSRSAKYRRCSVLACSESCG
jgi:conjugal transfer pilus assembly protein TraU